MPPAKKKELFNPMEEWKAALQSRQYELEEGGSIYEEEPVDILTFVTSKNFLGIAPQRDPITGMSPDKPLSDPQLDFIEKATDFENNTTEFVLWVNIRPREAAKVA